MKNKILCLIFLSLIGGFNLLKAQDRLTNNLCYQEEFTQKISITSDIDLSTLSILDKLKFKQKNYTKEHHEYVNKNGNTTRDVHIVAHENMFPKWYTPATTIRTDETGTKSYFTEDNKYLRNGWSGGTKSKTDHGEYIQNVKTGERYLYVPHSKLANEYYVSKNKEMEADGALSKYAFAAPSTSDIANMRSEGTKVLQSKNLVKAENSTGKLIWETNEKIFVRQILEGEKPVKTIKTFYKFNEELKMDLIHKTVTIKPGTFDNGNYFETITSSVYTNYSIGCEPKDLALKSKPTLKINSDLEILPNPASNFISFNIPDTSLKSNVQVSNVMGGILLERNLSKDSDQYTLNVKDLPAGIYIIKLSQGNYNYSSKFVKQ